MNCSFEGMEVNTSNCFFNYLLKLSKHYFFNIFSLVFTNKIKTYFFPNFFLRKRTLKYNRQIFEISIINGIKYDWAKIILRFMFSFNYFLFKDPSWDLLHFSLNNNSPELAVNPQDKFDINRSQCNYDFFGRGALSLGNYFVPFRLAVNKLSGKWDMLNA
jgi:hypothetical protein